MTRVTSVALPSMCQGDSMGRPGGTKVRAFVLFCKAKC